MFLKPHETSLLIVVSGPAGSGKTTLCRHITRHYGPKIERVITCTTRPARTGEVPGVDYHFLSQRDFEEKIQQGAFYEWAIVHNHYYGSLKQEIQEGLGQTDLLMIIDVQGAKALRQASETDPTLAGRLVTVFIMASNLDVLHQRLLQRDAGDPAEIRLRLHNAMEEIKHVFDYDYCILSQSENADFQRFDHIYQAEKMRLRRSLFITSPELCTTEDPSDLQGTPSSQQRLPV